MDTLDITLSEEEKDNKTTKLNDDSKSLDTSNDVSSKPHKGTNRVLLSESDNEKAMLTTENTNIEIGKSKQSSNKNEEKQDITSFHSNIKQESVNIPTNSNLDNRASKPESKKHNKFQRGQNKDVNGKSLISSELREISASESDGAENSGDSARESEDGSFRRKHIVREIVDDLETKISESYTLHLAKEAEKETKSKSKPIIPSLGELPPRLPTTVRDELDSGRSSGIWDGRMDGESTGYVEASSPYSLTYTTISSDDDDVANLKDVHTPRGESPKNTITTVAETYQSDSTDGENQVVENPPEAKIKKTSFSRNPRTINIFTQDLTPAVSRVKQQPSGKSSPYARNSTPPGAPMSPWRRYHTDEGAGYWYNDVTGVSQWEPPEGSSADDTALYRKALAAISRLHDAVANRQEGEIRMLVAAGIHINAYDSFGLTPIFYADVPEILDYLLKLGASPFLCSSNNDRESLLHHMAKFDRGDLMQILLNATCENYMLEPQYELYDANGNTAFHVAVQSESDSCVKVLMQYQTVTDSPHRYQYLMEIEPQHGNDVYSEATEVTKFLVERKMVELEMEKWKTYAMEIEKNQRPIRDRAEQAERRNQELQIKIRELEDRNSKLEQHCTILDDELTSRNQEIEMLQIHLSNLHIEMESMQAQGTGMVSEPSSYVEAEQYPERQNALAATIPAPWQMCMSDDGTPYYLNVETGESQWEQPVSAEPVANDTIGKVWMKFFERAAKASLHRDDTPRNPNEYLAMGIDLIDPQIVREALENGATLTDDLSDNSEIESILHRCSALLWNADKVKQKRIVDIATLLIQYGADFNMMSSRRVAPVHIACSVGNGDLVELYLAYGADIFALDENLDTPLHCAAMGSTKGHFKCVHLLTSYGAELNCRNRQGHTPLDCARRQMLLCEYPPKPLLQIVDLLKQLQMVVGDDGSNPMGEASDTGSERSSRSDRRKTSRKPSPSSRDPMTTPRSTGWWESISSVWYGEIKGESSNNDTTPRSQETTPVQSPISPISPRMEMSPDNDTDDDIS